MLITKGQLRSLLLCIFMLSIIPAILKTGMHETGSINVPMATMANVNIFISFGIKYFDTINHTPTVGSIIGCTIAEIIWATSANLLLDVVLSDSDIFSLLL